MNEKLLRCHGLKIIDLAIKAVRPENIIHKHVWLNESELTIYDRKFHLKDFSKICILGAGKAGASMALSIETILGRNLHDGLVVVKEGHKLNTGTVKLIEAGHPVPDQRSVIGCQQLINFIRKYNQADTLFIFLLSGGASSLLTSPAKGITLADKQQITDLLLACGADIKEINTVRKHLSNVKGGRLAQLMQPAHVVSLIISDVIGDNLETIGSGPTAGDPSSWSDCRNILTYYDLFDQISEPVRNSIIQGEKGLIEDTPSPDEPYFKNVSNNIIASNEKALLAAADAARQLHYQTFILPKPISGETKKAVAYHLEIIRKITNNNHSVSPPCCIISGGETTVKLEDDPGIGGRNQEFALSAAIEMDGLKNVALFSVGTDGTDGPTDAAGALATGSTAARARKMKLDPFHYLVHHDSYTFFDRIGDLIITGPTLTNVMDIHIILLASNENG